MIVALALALATSGSAGSIGRGLRPTEVPPSEAASEAFSLDWHAAATCPAADVVRAAIRESLRASPPSQRVVATARVRESTSGPGLQLTLVLHQGGTRGTRVVDSASCDELAELTAWLVALAVDPRLVRQDATNINAVQRESRQSPTGDASPIIPVPVAPAPVVTDGRDQVVPAIPASPAPPQAVASASTTPSATTNAATESTTSKVEETGAGRSATVARRASTEAPSRDAGETEATVAHGPWSVHAGGGLAHGVAPLIAPALALGIGRDAGRLARVELAGWYQIPRVAASEVDASVTARLSSGAAVLRGCLVPSRPRVEFLICLGGELGGVRGVGREGDRARAATWLWGGIGTELGLVARLTSRLGVRLGVDVVWSWTTPGFAEQVDGPRMFQIGRFGERVFVALQWRLR